MNQHTEGPIEATGTVVFLLFGAGTKSEAKVPFLYVNKDIMYKLFLKGDNPFENNGLIPFDGKRVRVSGINKENIKKELAQGTLVADSIVPEEEPDQTPVSEP